METEKNTNNNIKDVDLIGFDLDGTLAESKTTLDQEMSGLLCRLLHKKNIVIASGASFDQFENQFLSHFLCEKDCYKNLYLLPTNGATLYEYADKAKFVYKHELTPEKIKLIFSAFDKALTETGYGNPSKIYGTLIEDRKTQVTFSGLGSKAPLSEKSVWDPDFAKRKKIVEILRPLLPDFSIGMGGVSSIDVTENGVDKAYGMDRLMVHLDIPKERTLYVGDALFPGGNDSSVLRLGIGTHEVGGVNDTKSLIRSWLSELE